MRDPWQDLPRSIDRPVVAVSNVSWMRQGIGREIRRWLGQGTIRVRRAREPVTWIGKARNVRQVPVSR